MNRPSLYNSDREVRVGQPTEKLADAACGVPARTQAGQTPPVGNGAHSVPFEASSLAECAPLFAGGLDTSGREAPAMPLTSAAGASQHRGTGILDIDEIVSRVLAANRLIERIWEPCPQGTDCDGDGQHTRIFDCEQGCGFRGCTACLMAHDAEPHWSDSDTAREMWGDRGIG
jgi:hypothetical protein